jgi:hypothetical protein
MDNVETFAQQSAGADRLSRRSLIAAFAATLAATQVLGMGTGGPEAAAAVAAPAQSPPAYDAIVGLL